MSSTNRRAFLAEIGRGMLIGGIGASVAWDMGIRPTFAAEGSDRLNLGAMEPLAALMEETSADRILSAVSAELSKGTTLKTLVAAAALANARKFGGEDYIGFHTFMALGPALSMTPLLPANKQALPVFKVLYRNTSRIQDTGGAKEEVLHEVKAAAGIGGSYAEAIRQSVHDRDPVRGEGQLAAVAMNSAIEAYNALLPTVHENQDVHRIVLAHRVWDMLDVVGPEYATTLLRQSLRYCAHNEEWRQKNPSPSLTLVPRLLEQYKLLDPAQISVKRRAADGGWTDALAKTIFEAQPEQAADAVAQALAEGFEIDAIAEAISTTTNQLLLRDTGRSGRSVQPNKPEGSVHGDSIGVHASDTSHAWRLIAKVSDYQNSICSMILAGYNAARDRVATGADFLNWKARPFVEDLEKVTASDPNSLLSQLEGAIQEKNQNLACAVVQKYGEHGHDVAGVRDVLLKYAISQDGALHAEKYFRTCTDNFAITRASYRWNHMVALARVTASEFGYPAPGYDESCKLLAVN